MATADDDTLWRIANAVRDNNSEFVGSHETRWCSRAEGQRVLARASKLKEVGDAIRDLIRLGDGETIVVGPRRQRVVGLPTSEVFANIPYGEEEPDIKSALLLTKGDHRGPARRTLG